MHFAFKVFIFLKYIWFVNICNAHVYLPIFKLNTFFWKYLLYVFAYDDIYLQIFIVYIFIKYSFIVFHIVLKYKCIRKCDNFDIREC